MNIYNKIVRKRVEEEKVVLGAQDEILRIRMERAMEKLRVMETLLETKDREIQELKNKLNEKSADKDVVSMMLSTVLLEIDEDGGDWFGGESNLSKINRLQSLISNLKSKKNQAESVAEMKSSFLANMSHEIRTPMNGIMGLTKLLLNTELSEKQNEYLRAIESSSDTLLVIINDILDISKIEAGKLSIEKKDFLFKNLLSSVIGVFEGKAAEKGIQIVASYHENELPDVLVGDSVRLNQILYNLISNAVKFTPSGSVELKVSPLRRNSNDITFCFEVLDTGIGMTKEQQGKVFDAFSQANSSTTRKFGGTGLGLSIVKKLVELQGGEIRVKSEPEVGTTFSFRLTYPYKSINESNVIKTDTLGVTNLTGVKILLVEDNPVNQLVATDLLEEVSALVEVANNGLEGLAVFEKGDFDIVLMDMQMPVMDGYEAISNLRAKGFKTPVIALTAHITEREVEKCMQAGADEYLSKPYKPQDLYSKIAGLLNVENVELALEKREVSEKIISLWDKNHLLEYVGGSEKIMNRILDKIKSELPEDIKVLIEFQKENDNEKLAAVCHKMKPNIQMLGNSKLYNLIVQMELDAKSNDDFEEMPERVGLLIIDLKQLIEELD